MKSFKLHSDNEGESTEFSIKRVGIVVGLILIIAVTWIYAIGGLSLETGSIVVQDAYEQVSRDSVEQYNIAKRQGDPVQVCVQAMFVSAAYLQEQNESKYREWKSIEEKECN